MRPLNFSSTVTKAAHHHISPPHTIASQVGTHSIGNQAILCAAPTRYLLYILSATKHIIITLNPFIVDVGYIIHTRFGRLCAVYATGLEKATCWQTEITDIFYSMHCMFLLNLRHLNTHSNSFVFKHLTLNKKNAKNGISCFFFFF